MTNQSLDESKLHRQWAVQLFNRVWELMDMEKRDQEDTDEMIHAVHASRYHWGMVGAPVNLARGEWQISRVYSVLQRPEPALYHARRCLEICLENKIGDFDLAFAYEALARASMVAGNPTEKTKYLELAHHVAAAVTEEDDRQILLNDLGTIV
jgi:hypothetical protein